jgi:hypothetical protein
MSYNRVEYRLTYDPIEYVDPLVREDQDGITIAYLINDPFKINPMEEIGGHIHETNSKEGLKALGLDWYGNPILDEVEMEYHWRNWLDAIPNEEERNRLSFLGWARCDEAGWDYDSMAEKCYFPPKRFSRLLDRYAHCGEMFSLHNEGYQCRWDTARGSHIWVPNADLEHDLLELVHKQPERKEDEIIDEFVRKLLEQYNSYLAGECWEVIVEKYDSDAALIDTDIFCQVIGHDEADRQLQEAIKERSSCLS